MLRARLHSGFRYIHEPLPAGDSAIPVLGHEVLVTALRERLTYSHGGAFLITGFRGVGKSTLVLRALAQTAASWGRDDRLLVVHLNVGRAMTPDQLLFAIVRRVFEALDDGALLDRLPRDVLGSLLTAYARTSLSFKQTQTDSSERGGTAGIGPSKGVLSALAPTASLTGKRTRSQAMEAAFLAYSETDVEHDLVRIIRLLNGDEGRPQADRARRRRGRRREARARLRVHPVVILDEVDKLTDSRPEAIAEFEDLLGRLKNVLTTRGAHFLVVAGPDLHDRALHDGDRGNGVYESVFSWRAYVPCLWQAPGRLVEGVVDGFLWETDGGPPRAPSATAVDELVRYLQFKARGVPRRLLHEFNALVVWEEGVPHLAVGAADRDRMRFYRELQEVVAGIGNDGGTSGIAALAIDEDRRLLGDYHVTDWALRSRGRPFTSADVMSTAGEQRLDPLLRVEAVRVEQVLRHLARAGVLEDVSAGTQITRYGRGDEGELTSYRLSDGYRRALAGFARSNERERADQRVTWSVPAEPSEITGGSADGRAAAVPPDAVSVVTETPLVGTLAEGRYEVRRLIGNGGMGSVYSGRDRLTGRDVAIKMLHTRLADDEEMRRRFEREAAVGQRLHHPHIVQFLDFVSGGSGEQALVMEVVEGPSLSEYVAERGALPPVAAAAVGRNLGSALQAVEQAGLARIDLKPGNVILHPRRGAVLIDLGLARATDGDLSITHTGIVVGTPGYMAPEQVLGGPYSILTDLYALGLVMIYCLTGEAVWTSGSSNMMAVLHRIANENVPVEHLPVSGEMRTLLGRITARDPADRPAVADFLSALARTPEGEATEIPLRD